VIRPLIAAKCTKILKLEVRIHSNESCFMLKLPQFICNYCTNSLPLLLLAVYSFIQQTYFTISANLTFSQTRPQTVDRKQDPNPHSHFCTAKTCDRQDSYISTHMTTTSSPAVDLHIHSHDYNIITCSRPHLVRQTRLTYALTRLQHHHLQ